MSLRKTINRKVIINLYSSFLPKIKKAFDNKEDLIHLFYVIEDDIITDLTDLGKALTACQVIEAPMGFTAYDIITGKVDPNIALMLEAKLYIDDEVSKMSYSKEKKKKSKFEEENKIIMFKNKKDKGNDEKNNDN